MKQLVSFLTMALILLPAVGTAHGNKPGSSSTTVEGGEIRVDFVGPSVNGRDVLKLLQPGAYWRMGADKATTLETSVALKFGDMLVPKGTYTLVAHLSNDGKWSLIVAEDLGSGFKPRTVVGRVIGTISKTDVVTDNMQIRLEADGVDINLVLDWGNARLTARFTVG